MMGRYALIFRDNPDIQWNISRMYLTMEAAFVGYHITTNEERLMGNVQFEAMVISEYNWFNGIFKAIAEPVQSTTPPTVGI